MASRDEWVNVGDDVTESAPPPAPPPAPPMQMRPAARALAPVMARAFPDDIVTGVASCLVLIVVYVIHVASWYICVKLDMWLAGCWLWHTAMRATLDQWVWYCTAPRPTPMQLMIVHVDDAIDRLAQRAGASCNRAWRRVVGTIDWEEAH